MKSTSGSQRDNSYDPVASKRNGERTTVIDTPKILLRGDKKFMQPIRKGPTSSRLTLV